MLIKIDVITLENSSKNLADIFSCFFFDLLKAFSVVENRKIKVNKVGGSACQIPVLI